MSDWTNAYWPRSGERGSASSDSSSRRTSVASRPARLSPVLAGRWRPARQGEALAQDGGHLDQRAIGRLERVEARRDERPERVRDGQRREVADRTVAAVGHLEAARRPRAPGRSRRRRAGCRRPVPGSPRRPSRAARARSRRGARASPSVASGSRASVVSERAAAPQPGRRSSSSGRARVTTRIGELRDQARSWSMKSRRPESAHCRSSKRRIVVPCSAIRSKKIRQAAKSDVASAGRGRLEPQERQQRRLDPAAILVVRHELGHRRGDPCRASWPRRRSRPARHAGGPSRRAPRSVMPSP